MNKRNHKRIIKRKNKLFCKYNQIHLLDEFYKVVKMDTVGEEYETLSDFIRGNK